jgi:hypothetical protein
MSEGWPQKNAENTKDMNDELLEQLASEALASVDAMRDRMKSVFPLGSRWKVRLRDSQVNPTVMTVRHHHWSIAPTVEFCMPRKGCKIGRVLRRAVPLKRIVGPVDE